MQTIEEINAAIEARKGQLLNGSQEPEEQKPMSLREIEMRLSMRERKARMELEKTMKAEPSESEASKDGNFFADSAGGIGRQMVGGAEAAGTVLQNTLVDAIGGFGALAGALDPTAPKGTAVANLNAIRDLLAYDPRTPEAKAALESLSGYLEPVSEPLESARQSLNDETLRRTDSPVAAGLASALPDLALEVVGFGQGKRAAQAADRAADVAQAKRSAQAEIDALESSTGVPQMTTDVLPPQTRTMKLLRDQGELLTGGMRNRQQEARVKSIENLAQRYGVEDGANYESRILKGLKTSIGAEKAKFSELYSQSSGALDKLGEVPLSNAKAWAQTEISKQLRLGAKGDKQKIADLEALIEAPDDLSFELVKEIRSGVGAQLESARRGAPVTGSSDTGFLKRQYAELSKDMRTFADEASPELAADWKAADAKFSSFANDADKSTVKSVMRSGDATPEDINKLLFSTKNSDLEFLAKYLDEGGKSSAKQSIIQRLVDKSTNPDGDISPNAFINQVKKHRNQIGKFFSKDESRAILALKDALSSTRRAQDSAVTTPTGQGLYIPFIAGNLVTSFTPAMAAYIVETPKARALIIRRKAAKTARERQTIDAELRKIMSESGLINAATAGAVTTAQEQKQEVKK